MLYINICIYICVCVHIYISLTTASQVIWHLWMRHKYAYVMKQILNISRDFFWHNWKLSTLSFHGMDTVRVWLKPSRGIIFFAICWKIMIHEQVETIGYEHYIYWEWVYQLGFHYIQMGIYFLHTIFWMVSNLYISPTHITAWQPVWAKLIDISTDTTRPFVRANKSGNLKLW